MRFDPEGRRGPLPPPERCIRFDYEEGGPNILPQVHARRIAPYRADAHCMMPLALFPIPQEWDPLQRVWEYLRRSRPDEPRLYSDLMRGKVFLRIQWAPSPSCSGASCYLADLNRVLEMLLDQRGRFPDTLEIAVSGLLYRAFMLPDERWFRLLPPPTLSAFLECNCMAKLHGSQVNIVPTEPHEK